MLKLILRGLKKEQVESRHIKGNAVYYHERTLATLQYNENDEVIFLIDPQLEMSQYEVIREAILQITAGKDITIDESECQLGYLQNGESAHLIRNWEPWKEFLMKARLRTLEGQNVIVKNEEGEDLDNGLLAEYATAENPFRITSCTVITIFGERKYEGESLVVEPTNQFS
ncbi:hypothetical protein [Bacillus sp. FJAT-27251]|uniref:hypothetical protein n=1 Tax=Bacillus sp. FJAT-27251 TaxID=1684142 RepID=UPI0006A75ACE|nr:hypothetical protein [Bacillus sp. FJAT-27251]